MVLTRQKSGAANPRTAMRKDEDRHGPDLPPEYCTYRDEGCDHAAACLECPFPRCLYDVPRGRQRHVARARKGSLHRLRGEGWKIRELAAPGGAIVVPVNCGQQLYDVVSVTDARAGLAGVSRRVVGITLTREARRGVYRMRLDLGAV
jgi:hypothetical protein